MYRMLQCDYGIRIFHLPEGAKMSTDNSPEKNNIETLLKEGKTIQLKPHGYSMYPLLVPERDEVIVAPLGDHKIRRGDVIIFRRPAGKLIIHRVHSVKNNGVYLIGDNEHLIEGPVPFEYVYGIMTSFIRKGKKYTTGNLIYKFYWKSWLLLINFREPISKFVHKIKSVGK